MNTELMFSSKTDEWETPQNLFDELNKEFKFELDVCADFENHKCNYYFDKAKNGLSADWWGRCWMNPPYGREIGKWVKKAYEEVQGDAAGVCVCLLPSRTDTKWFHDYCLKGEIRFLKGRLLFKKDGRDPSRSERAPFPSMIVIFRSREVSP